MAAPAGNAPTADDRLRAAKATYSRLFSQEPSKRISPESIRKADRAIALSFSGFCPLHETTRFNEDGECDTCRRGE